MMQYINVGSLLGIITFLGGLLAWYRGSVEKSYAAKRDFGHLKKSLETLITNLETLRAEDDRRFDELKDRQLEIKAMLYSAFTSRQGWGDIPRGGKDG
jgi:hypothetical protein